jgi:hypothetical protein
LFCIVVQPPNFLGGLMVYKVADGGAAKWLQRPEKPYFTRAFWGRTVQKLRSSYLNRNLNLSSIRAIRISIKITI